MEWEIFSSEQKVIYLAYISCCFAATVGHQALINNALTFLSGLDTITHTTRMDPYRDVLSKIGLLENFFGRLISCLGAMNALHLTFQRTLHIDSALSVGLLSAESIG